MDHKFMIEREIKKLQEISEDMQLSQDQLMAAQLTIPETEEALLGALLIDPVSIGYVKSIVRPGDLDVYANNLVYEAILNLHTRGEGVDNVTVSEELVNTNHIMEVGLGEMNGIAYITYLINSCSSSIHVKTYARLVQSAAQRRRWLIFAGRAANEAVRGDIRAETVNANIYAEYRKVTDQLASPDVIGGRALLSKIYDNYERYVNNPSLVRGLPSGIQQLDEILMGFTPGLYQVGGASSMGKSTFAGGLVRAFMSKARGTYLPTEVLGEKALEKIACDMAGIPFKKFRSGFMTAEEHSAWHEAFTTLGEYADNLTVIDGDQPTMEAIESTISATKSEWLIVDSGTAYSYQIMAARKGKIDLRMATTEFCQRLQNIARRGVTVVALWQTGRNSKDRANKEPQLYDFKEAGAIEETGDVALALYRHSYYVKRGLATEDFVTYPEGTGDILVLKDRDGGEGDGRVTVAHKMGHGFTDYHRPATYNPNTQDRPF